MKTYFAVTGVVFYKEKFLILKKAPDSYNYPKHWSLCSGYIKEFEAGEDTIIREIKEETGLDAEIIKVGKLVHKHDKEKDVNWVILPFVCKVDSDKVTLDHENTDFRWITKDELKDYKFVPGLIEDLKGVGLL